MSLKAIILPITVGILLNILVYLCLKEQEETPAVYWSVSQQACEKIVKNGEEIECKFIETMPKYEIVYVK